jgi:acetylornithine aminotransferase
MLRAVVNSPKLILNQRDGQLSNPDPTANSQTAALVEEQAPYMVKTYARPPPMFVKGEGCYLWDVENRKYLDFTAGIAVNALGHCDPEISKLIADQVRISKVATSIN